MPTLRQSPEQVPDKVADTKFMKVANFMICVRDKVRRHKSRKSADFVADTYHEIMKVGDKK